LNDVLYGVDVDVDFICGVYPRISYERRVAPFV